MTYPTFPMCQPFDYLIKQIQTDLNRAVQLCEDIKTNRNVGLHHKNLDELEEALRAGPAFVSNQATSAQGLPGADIDGGDSVARATMAGFLNEVGEIGS